MKRKRQTSNQDSPGQDVSSNATYVKNISPQITANATYTATIHPAAGGDTTYTASIHPRLTANTTYNVTSNNGNTVSEAEDTDMDCELSAHQTYTKQTGGVDIGSSLFVPDGDTSQTREYVKPLTYDSSSLEGKVLFYYDNFTI